MVKTQKKCGYFITYPHSKIMFTPSAFLISLQGHKSAPLRAS